MGNPVIRRIGKEEFLSQEFRKAWEELADNASFYDSGLSYTWVSTWWNFFSGYGLGKKDLFVLAFGNGGRIEGIAPMMRRRMFRLRILELIGQSGGATTDYTGFVIREGSSGAFFTALYGYLLENRKEWDILSVVVPEEPDLFSDQVREIVALHLKKQLRYRVSFRDNYSRIGLPSTFEEYVQGLGRRTRTDLRQYLRIADSPEVKFEILQGEAMKSGFGDLVSLNRGNWGYFNEDAIRKFYEAEVEGTGPGDAHPFLARLTAGNEPVAMVQGFIHRSRCFLHTSGVKRQTVMGIAPGLTLYGFLIRELIGRGCRSVDLSPGLEEYKLRMGIRIHPLMQVEAFTSVMTMNYYFVIKFLRKAYRSLAFPVRSLSRIVRRSS
jgi:hypothetical protein